MSSHGFIKEDFIEIHSDLNPDGARDENRKRRMSPPPFLNFTWHVVNDDDGANQ